MLYKKEKQQGFYNNPMSKHELRYPRTIGVATDVSKNYLDCWTLDSVDRSLRRICAIANFVNFCRRTITLQTIRDFCKNIPLTTIEIVRFKWLKAYQYLDYSCQSKR